MQMKIAAHDALNVYAGLRSLDGYEDVIKDGEKQSVARKPYKFGVGFRLLIAKNSSALEKLLRVHGKARDAVLVELSGGTGDLDAKKNPAAFAQFKLKEQELLEAEHDIVLVKFKVDQLNLEANAALPPSAIAALSPIIED